MKVFYNLLVLTLLSCAKNTSKNTASTTSFCDNIQQHTTEVLSKTLDTLSEQMTSKTGVYVLENGTESMIARAWLSKASEKTIDIQYFIFSLDNIGLIACDYIVRAADRGIKVRILVDDLMVDADIEDILTLNAHENISIKIYNPGANLGKNIFSKIKKLTTDFRSVNQRMHNKTFIIDDQVVITGGRNIADEYFDYDHEYNFRDRDVLLFGKETKPIANSFNEFWNHELSVPITNLSKNAGTVNSDTFNKLHEYACNPENFWPEVRNQIQNFPTVLKEIQKTNQLVWVDDVSFISDAPGKNDGSQGLLGGGISTTKLIDLVKNAKHTIDIQSPYLITTELGQQLFKKAVDRGIKIRILTNSLASTDNLPAFSGYQKNRKQLLETGIRIFEFRPDAAERVKMMTNGLQKSLDHTPIFGLHAKTMVIDNETSVIGTFNLDPRSANLNTECITIIKSKSVAQGILKGMELEFKPENSWETTLDFNPDSEVSKWKRAKTWTRKILPKEIL